MWSMWNAPSDRDYYDQFKCYDEIIMADWDEDRCMSCGSGLDTACEEWCSTRDSAELSEDVQ